jgi:hypothetical protein
MAVSRHAVATFARGGGDKLGPTSASTCGLLFDRLDPYEHMTDA